MTVSVGRKCDHLTNCWGTLLDDLQGTERTYVEGENQKLGDDKASNLLVDRLAYT